MIDKIFNLCINKCDCQLISREHLLKVRLNVGFCHLGDCYMDRGRWYNGTVNVTKSGKPCQSWSSNQPQKHKRQPEVYRELESSENYCRNAGSEEESPWCYINTNNPGERWELCDIPACGTKAF